MDILSIYLVVRSYLQAICAMYHQIQVYKSIHAIHYYAICDILYTKYYTYYCLKY